MIIVGIIIINDKLIINIYEKLHYEELNFSELKNVARLHTK